jgi:hypothetical protein
MEMRRRLYVGSSISMTSTAVILIDAGPDLTGQATLDLFLGPDERPGSVVICVVSIDVLLELFEICEGSAEITLYKPEDLERAMPLIKRSYENS